MPELKNKVITVPLQKESSKTDAGTLMKRGFFTSDQRDEVGDIITRAATEAAIPKYRQWGNIRYMHQPRPVGKVRKIGREDGLAWNEVEFEVIDPQAVFEVEHGLLSALSVGILVDFDDIDMLEDGGWVINGYQLAEISLVDHPANYDAALKGPVGDELRTLARTYGFDAVAREMYHLLEPDKENSMDTENVIEEEAVEKDLPEVEEEAPEVDEAVEAEKDIDPEEPEEEEEAPEVEKDLEDQVDAEAVEDGLEEYDVLIVEERELDPEEEDDEEAEEVEKDLDETEDEQDEPSDRELLQRVIGDIADIRTELTEIKNSLEAITKSLNGGNVDGDVEEKSVENADVDEDPDSVPVNRQAAVPETEPIEGEEVEKVEPLNLRRALRQHLERNN